MTPAPEQSNGFVLQTGATDPLGDYPHFAGLPAVIAANVTFAVTCCAGTRHRPIKTTAEREV